MNDTQYSHKKEIARQLLIVKNFHFSDRILVHTMGCNASKLPVQELETFIVDNETKKANMLNHDNLFKKAALSLANSQRKNRNELDKKVFLKKRKKCNNNKRRKDTTQKTPSTFRNGPLSSTPSCTR